MKRRYLPLVTFCAMFYCSCCKDQPTYPYVPAVHDLVALSEKQSGIISIVDSTANPANIYVSLITGDAANDRVSVYLNGLPPGITSSFDTGFYALPAYIQGNLTANCDTGNYNITLNVNSRNKGVKQYPFVLHVLPVTDGARGLVGVYAGNDPCGHFSEGDTWYSYTASVTTTHLPHWIAIKNYRGLGDSVVVYASVQPDQQTSWVGSIDIPLQTTHGYTIFGRGKGYYGIQENQKPWISVYGDTIVHAGDTFTCFTQLKIK